MIRRVKTVMNERGDTLVEVMMAAAILSLILVAAFVTANRSYLLGEQSKEQSVLVSVAQQQTDALKSFRDSHNWSQFFNGSNSSLSFPTCNTGANYCGIKVQNDGGDCDLAAPGINHCFYMVPREFTIDGKLVTQWVPIYGALSGVVGTGSGINFTIGTTPYPGLGPANGRYVDVRLIYGNTERGSNNTNATNVWVRLANLDGLR